MVTAGGSIDAEGPRSVVGVVRLPNIPRPFNLEVPGLSAFGSPSPPPPGSVADKPECDPEFPPSGDAKFSPDSGVGGVSIPGVLSSLENLRGTE